jgi:hypothetical protein
MSIRRSTKRIFCAFGGGEGFAAGGDLPSGINGTVLAVVPPRPGEMRPRASQPTARNATRVLRRRLDRRAGSQERPDAKADLHPQLFSDRSSVPTRS